MIYRDRRHAGASLAERLLALRSENPIVLALPRGGVPVAYEIAKELDASLDVILARKLGAPDQPEFGFGAIAPGAIYLDADTVNLLGLTEAEIQSIIAREEKELERRKRRYEIVRRFPIVEGRTVILVDDGLATGVTARAAIASLRKQNPRKIIFAVPVCAPGAAASVAKLVDEIVCGAMPERFASVGDWYQDFEATTDEEVIALLCRAAAEHEEPGAGQVPSAPDLSYFEESP